MIACLTPSECDFMEMLKTLQTLRTKCASTRTRRADGRWQELILFKTASLFTAHSHSRWSINQAWVQIHLKMPHLHFAFGFLESKTFAIFYQKHLHLYKNTCICIKTFALAFDYKAFAFAIRLCGQTLLSSA